MNADIATNSGLLYNVFQHSNLALSITHFKSSAHCCCYLVKPETIYVQFLVKLCSTEFLQLQFFRLIVFLITEQQLVSNCLKSLPKTEVSVLSATVFLTLNKICTINGTKFINLLLSFLIVISDVTGYVYI